MCNVNTVFLHHTRQSEDFTAYGDVYIGVINSPGSMVRSSSPSGGTNSFTTIHGNRVSLLWRMGDNKIG